MSRLLCISFLPQHHQCIYHRLSDVPVRCDSQHIWYHKQKFTSLIGTFQSLKNADETYLTSDGMRKNTGKWVIGYLHDIIFISLEPRCSLKLSKEAGWRWCSWRRCRRWSRSGWRRCFGFGRWWLWNQFHDCFVRFFRDRWCWFWLSWYCKRKFL